MVLDGWYDADHVDHIHAEGVRSPVLDRGARSATVFCQPTCNRVFGANLMVDGRWGDKTEDAMKQAQARTGATGDLTDSPAWQDRLRRVAELALPGRTAP